ncbi:MAG TPA: hypothetical protein VFX20_06320 [Steroidobacteraceae bacterium]|nr:hypothetical protein [Steroidobacteraceae bacterium]
MSLRRGVSLTAALLGFAEPRGVLAGVLEADCTAVGVGTAFEARTGRGGFPGTLALGAARLGGCGGSLARRSVSGSMRSSSAACPGEVAAGAASG